MDIFLHCLYAFLVGGFICLIGQVLIDYTKLTPARILVSYVVAGVILTAIGVYEPIVKFAGAGATGASHRLRLQPCLRRQRGSKGIRLYGNTDGWTDRNCGRHCNCRCIGLFNGSTV